ncbi:hypothetical protein SAMN03159343_3323 [Klenkia marina]|uniref:Uncharacterized protein n=1 Tax=Klenkia marina TaxID=1960309 RepID=A0A1G4YQB4_9ACTN|nr:hypothetical protein [Klenkia marina]SCX55584.1 hypothetical protein SAMN03159343_3323 [Klenkia marina]
MRLASADGAWLDLRVLRRQAVEVRAVELDRADWAQTWLLVRGEVRTADGRGWVFREPCLTPWEGNQLGSWLRAVAERPGGLLGTGLLAADPTLSWVLDDARGDRRLLRVHLTGPAAWTDPVTAEQVGGGVPLDVTVGTLLGAAEEWLADIAASG